MGIDFHGGRIYKPDTRDYKMETVMATLKSLGVTSKAWVPGQVLNQQETNHCVGFSFAGWGLSTPVVDKWTDADGHRIYYEAVTIDGTPTFEGGTCVRSGAKALVKDGRMGVYSFSQDINTAAEYVSTYGPVVLGIDWYNSMMTPGPSGQLNVDTSSGIAGGHAILWYSVWSDMGKDYATLRNSWGDWGVQGDCIISLSDLSVAFGDQGEACAATELPIMGPAPYKPRCKLLKALMRL